MQETLPLHAPTTTLKVLPPLSLYVHVPWCVRKCPYCDFNSHELRGELPVREYLEAVTGDLESAVPLVWGRPVRSIFLGGGTPSLLPATAVDELLAAIRARLPLLPDAEITLEANPGTVDTERFAGFRAAGVNRLSIGVQSFDPARLRSLGRIHDDAQARAAVEAAREHFANFNVDLMYALPGQGVAQAIEDVDAAIALGPTHVSAYHLTIEPNTPFHRNPPVVPDPEAAAEIQEAVESRLAQAGYAQYEVSAFARPQSQAVHNLNYWTFGDYLGIGPGAHGKVSFPDRILRQARVKHPRQYFEAVAAGNAVQEQHEISGRDLVFEFAMNALRLTAGFELALFEERTGRPLTELLRPMDRAERLGLVERDHRRARPTLRGQRFLNDLLQLFLPDAET